MKLDNNRQYFLLTTFSLCVLMMTFTTIFCYADQKKVIDGFGKLKWGQSIDHAIKTYPDLKLVGSITGPDRRYFRTEEDYIFGYSKPGNVHYFFYNNRFYKVIVVSEYNFKSDDFEAQSKLSEEYKSAIKEGRKMSNVSDEAIKLLVLSELYKMTYEKISDDIRYKYGNYENIERDGHKECLWVVGDTKIKLEYHDCLNSYKCGVEMEIENLKERSKKLGF